MTKRFEIQGGDGGCYGPVFGPVVGSEVCEIQGPSNEYLMVHLDQPLVSDDLTTEYVIVSPRYKRQKLKHLQRKGLTVGVFRVLPGREEDAKREVGLDNVDYWAVGECKPIN
jgi:hypothetical protein